MSAEKALPLDLENGPTDEELVASTVQGDLGAYDELIRRFQGRLYGVIYHLTSNHEDTNDLLMEVFDKAYRSLPTFRGQSSFYTWIYRIAINRSFNFLDKRKRRQGAMSLNELDEDGLPKVDLPDISPQNNQREEAAAPTPNRQRIRGVRMSERKRMNELPRTMADEERRGTATNPSEDNKLAMRKHGQLTPM